MQEAQWFENQIVKPSNLDFMNTSTAKNVQDTIAAFTNGNPGVGSGLLIAPTSIGTSVAVVTPGYGFLSTGERVQLYSPSGVNTFPASGTTAVFADLIEVNYNPDPAQNPAGASNVASGLNAASLEFQPVESYNLLQLTTVSGATLIRLAEVVTNFGLITSIDYTNRQNLKIGEVDLFSNTIDGSIISPSSIDSNQFVSPLNYDINIASGVNINFLGSGNQSIGSQTLPLSSIVAISGTFHDISGFSPILIDSMTQKDGTSLEASGAHVVIDTANKGTKLGGGLVLGANSIDLSEVTSSPTASTLTISTANLNGADINFSAGGAVNLIPGATSTGVNVEGPLNVTGNITITGSDSKLNIPVLNVSTLGIANAISGDTVFQGSVGISGNITSSGTLAFGATEQEFKNIIPNGLMYPSGASFSGTNIPNIWEASNPDANYVMGPIKAGSYFSFSPALNTWLQNRSELTFEWVFKSNTSGVTRLFAMRNTSPTQNMRLEANATQLYLYNENTGYRIVPDSTTTIASNAFTHVALTLSGTTASIFINGALAKTNTAANSPISSTVTRCDIGAYSTDSPGTAEQYYKSFKVSSKAHINFPSGLTNLEADEDTVALYNFNNTPSGINLIPASGLGNLINSSQIGFYEAPSGTYTIGSQFMGQSLSGSTVVDYTKDIAPAGSINVFSGETNSPYLFQISGNNITSNGLTLSTPLSVENSQTYKVSYFTKLISGSSVEFFSPDSNNVAVRAYVSGNGYISSTFNGENLSGEWSRSSFDFTAPANGEDFNLYVNMYSPSGNIVSGTSVVGLSSVQATKGSAQLSTLSGGPRVITLYHPLINRRIGRDATIVYHSGSIFSNGGVATITPSLLFDIMIANDNFTGFGAGGNQWMYIKHNVSLDGKPIVTDRFTHQVYVNNDMSEITANLTRPWAGYLTKGEHVLVSSLLVETTPGLLNGYITPSNTLWTSGAENPTGYNNPKTDIIMY